MGGNPRGFAALFCLFPNIALSDLLLTVSWFMIYYTTGGKSTVKKKWRASYRMLDIVSWLYFYEAAQSITRETSVWFRVDHIRIPGRPDPRP